jgi:hypothetical protein
LDVILDNTNDVCLALEVVNECLGVAH